MKNIFKYALLLVLGATVFSMNSYADVDPSEVVKLNKQILPVNADNGEYKIRLETYVTGSSVTHIEQVSVPIDLVLVLDVSSSMTSNYVPGNYNPRQSQDYTYQGYGNNTYYYFDQASNAYYQVKRGSKEVAGDSHTYSLRYNRGGGPGGGQRTLGSTSSSESGDLWEGILYVRNKKDDYTPQPSKTYKYNNYEGNLYYKFGDGGKDNSFALVEKVDDVNKINQRYLYFEKDGKTYYLSGTGAPTTTQPTNVTTDNATIWTGVLYSSTSITRLEALKNACNAFIDKVAENTAGEDGELGTDDDVQNRISIVTFGRHEKYITGTTDSATHSSIDDDRDPDGYENNFVSVYGEGAAANIATLKNHVTNLSTLSGTRQDRGLLGATNVLNAIDAERFAKSSKVVVVFTDGEPYAGHETNIDGDEVSTTAQARNKACAYSYVLKSGNHPTYTDKDGNSVPYKAKVFTVSMGEVTGANGYMMQYVSSNFPTVTGQNGSDPIPAGTQPVPGAKFSFTTDSGSNLTSIFESIAESSTEGGETYPLDASSTTLIDVVSNNFQIPAGTTAADVDVWAETYWQDNAGVPHWAAEYMLNEDGTWSTEKDPNYHYAGGVPTPTIDPATNTLSITNFDYAKDDDKDANDTPVPYTGNWVGPREFETGSGTETQYWGTRLVIEFPIKVNPNYEGGYAMPSNDLESGLYVNGQKILSYPVPTIDVPSICIMKDGLAVGESAVFDVTGPNDLHYTLTLTQTGEKPCYIVLKRLNSGTYTVKESKWSWLYTSNTATSITQEVIPASLMDITVNDLVEDGSDLVLDDVVVGRQASHTAIVDGKSYTGTFCVLKDKEGEYTVDELKGCAISLLYYFSNTRNTEGKPARAEAYAHNEFSGGKTGGGTETGGNEEEDI